MVPPTIIIGAGGYIGQHLLRAYRQIHSETVGTTRRQEECVRTGLAYLDLEKPDLDSLPITRGKFRAAIITAAISKVEMCLRDPERSRNINVTGTLQLVEQLHARNIFPIFLSTDYVFDGTSPDGYPDEAPLCPCTEYGRQKAAVETALRQMGKPYLVMRLSKNYSLRLGDGSFLDEIAAKLARGETYAAAFDQIFCPTNVEDLAPAIMKAQERGLEGVFNCCSPQPWSRYDIALGVARRLHLPDHIVRRISLDELPGQIQRPRNTRLHPTRLFRETGVRFITLEEGFTRLPQKYPSQQ